MIIVILASAVILMWCATAVASPTFGATQVGHADLVGGQATTFTASDSGLPSGFWNEYVEELVGTHDCTNSIGGNAADKYLSTWSTYGWSNDHDYFIGQQSINSSISKSIELPYGRTGDITYCLYSTQSTRLTDVIPPERRGRVVLHYRSPVIQLALTSSVGVQAVLTSGQDQNIVFTASGSVETNEQIYLLFFAGSGPCSTFPGTNSSSALSESSENQRINVAYGASLTAGPFPATTSYTSTFSTASGGHGYGNYHLCAWVGKSDTDTGATQARIDLSVVAPPAPPALPAPPPRPAKSCVVPSIRGLTYASAIKRIKKAHCRVGRYKYVRSGIRRGRAIRLSAPIRKRLAYHSKLTMFISTGPHSSTPGRTWK